ncbi:MAG: type II secretion system protein, partial [Chloroflexi bacterium]|nr:type II secretion system protein [Chloroflexota bacterium]
MTHRRVTFMHRNQRGFTLIELLIAIAIVGLIAGGITAAISQVLTINTRSSNHMIAVRQVQQAGKEVS